MDRSRGFGPRLRSGVLPALVAGIAMSPLAAVQQVDHQVQSEIQEVRGPALNRVANAAMEISKPKVVMGGLLAIAIFTGPAGPATARAALFAAASTNLMVDGLKRAIGRQRPDGDPNRKNASFPSGHAATAAALAAVLTARWRRAAALWWIIALTVGVSRMILNRHFMSDVLVGTAVGVAIAWVVLSRFPIQPGARTSQSLDADGGDAARTL
jgi:membrane-associated phospholipid phosphatase